MLVMAVEEGGGGIMLGSFRWPEAVEGERGQQQFTATKEGPLFGWVTSSSP